MPLRVAQFLALVLIALALVPSGAHLFALPNKIDLARDQYFVVQNIYRGWALFGVVLFGALIANLALALLLRGRGTPFVPALMLSTASRSRSWSSSSGPIRPIRRPTTGRSFRQTGSNCAGNGNIRTPPTPS